MLGEAVGPVRRGVGDPVGGEVGGVGKRRVRQAAADVPVVDQPVENRRVLGHQRPQQQPGGGEVPPLAFGRRGRGDERLEEIGHAAGWIARG